MKARMETLRPRTAGLPFLYLNAAMTADGKLGPATRQYEPFGSARDAALLHQLRARADAIMCGARTIDSQPVRLGSGGERYRRLRRRHGLSEDPLRIIVSGSGSLNPKAEIFKHRFSPIILLTTQQANDRQLDRLRRLVDHIHIGGDHEIDFHAALSWLRREWGVSSLLCEGGGRLNGALFLAGLVCEVHVTVCPLILGGHGAPTLADGQGVSQLSHAITLELKSMRQVGNEMFLCYTAPPVNRPRRKATAD